MLPDICVPLDIDIVENCGIITRRGLIDAAGECSEPRNRVDCYHVLWAALAKNTPDTCRHRGLTDATLAG
jgi:hypothetical protein